MESSGQKSLLLILSRELATNLATPMFLVDRTGRLVFYNEAAEHVLGQPFARTGEIGPDEWATMWHPEDLEGNPVALEDLPLARTMTERRPGHVSIRILGSDGVRRTVAITAVPLFARLDELVGAVCFFWEDAGTTVAERS